MEHTPRVWSIHSDSTSILYWKRAILPLLVYNLTHSASTSIAQRRKWRYFRAPKTADDTFSLCHCKPEFQGSKERNTSIGLPSFIKIDPRAFLFPGASNLHVLRRPLYFLSSTPHQPSRQNGERNRLDLLAYLPISLSYCVCLVSHISFEMWSCTIRVSK